VSTYLLCNTLAPPPNQCVCGGRRNKLGKLHQTPLRLVFPVGERTIYYLRFRIHLETHTRHLTWIETHANIKSIVPRWKMNPAKVKKKWGGGPFTAIGISNKWIRVFREGQMLVQHFWNISKVFWMHYSTKLRRTAKTKSKVLERTLPPLLPLNASNQPYRAARINYKTQLLLNTINV
jgi:hypothetical protein